MQSLFKGDDLNINDININFLKKRLILFLKILIILVLLQLRLLKNSASAVRSLTESLAQLQVVHHRCLFSDFELSMQKKKLVTEDKSIGQIAEECGFYDMAYFRVPLKN